MHTRVETVHGSVSLHRVLDDDHVAMLAEIARLTGTRKFPGSSPCSLERADFPKLRGQPYYVCEKTHGVRFLLVCCTLGDKRVCAIMDRAMIVHLLPLRAVPTAMFQGSIVDCELAFSKTEHQWQLLAFDALVVAGIRLMHRPFSVRMAALRRGMAAYAHVAGDPVSVRLKSFLPASMFEAYRAHEATTSATYDIDGLILTPELSPAIPGRNTDLFKVKTCHTVDFFVGSTGRDLWVYDASSRAHVHVADARTPLAAGTIMECVCGADGLWDPVCTRADKCTANDKLTFEKTLLNMNEGITADELVRFFAG